MRIGILGLEQSGKRTLFALLTGRRIEVRKADESPEGVAKILDPRVDVLSDICKPQKTVYAENHFVLCPDVAVGSGKREWLEAARRCDLLCMVVRAFESDQVYHPAGGVDAERDRETLQMELVFADVELVDRRLERLAREMKGGKSREQLAEQAVLEKLAGVLEGGGTVADADLSDDERLAIRHLGLVTDRPTLWTYNVSEDDLGADRGPGTFCVSAQIEQEIVEIEDPAERGEYLESMGLEASGLDRMNATAYDALGLMSFYTIGPDEVRAWTIRKGSLAPTAGGKVHTDIERGFIRVEIIKYDDLVAAGSEKAAKEKGRQAVKGRDYIIEDGDICHFLFNV
jgi:GTP-binding protein YchF